MVTVLPKNQCEESLTGSLARLFSLPGGKKVSSEATMSKPPKGDSSLPSLQAESPIYEVLLIGMEPSWLPQQSCIYPSADSI